MTLAGISSQGHKDSEDWVTKFKVYYSMDGATYERYMELGQKRVCYNNSQF